MSTSIPCKKDTRETYREYKQENETWDECLARVGNAYDPETFTAAIDVDASRAIEEIHHLEDLIDNLETKLSQETETDLGELSRKLSTEMENAAYRGSKQALVEVIE